MKNIMTIAVAVILANTQIAMADPVQAVAVDCASTFGERIKDARIAILRWQQEAGEHDRIMPWWREHCRWLEGVNISTLEHELSDQFECDTQEGRPEWLTTASVIAHWTRPVISDFQRENRENAACHVHDARDRVSLVVTRSFDPANQNKAQMREAFENEARIMCYKKKSAKCTKAWAAIEKSSTQPSSRASGNRSE